MQSYRPAEKHRQPGKQFLISSAPPIMQYLTTHCSVSKIWKTSTPNENSRECLRGSVYPDTLSKSRCSFENRFPCSPQRRINQRQAPRVDCWDCIVRRHRMKPCDNGSNISSHWGFPPPTVPETSSHETSLSKCHCILDHLWTSFYMLLICKQCMHDLFYIGIIHSLRTHYESRVHTAHVHTENVPTTHLYLYFTWFWYAK